MGAAVITYPHEVNCFLLKVLRTRLRQAPDLNGVMKYTGLINSTKIIFAEEGMRAFYGGMTAHLMRVVPNAAILFITYELIVIRWNSKMEAK